MIPKLKKKCSKKEVFEYLKWLGSSKYAYHIDDNVEDVIWDDIEMPKEDLLTLRKNSDIMWSVCTSDELWDFYFPILKEAKEKLA